MPILGTIDSRGYTPPAAAQVFWSNGTTKFLDPSKPFAGWHDSDIPRYGGGDQSLASHHPSAVGVEQRGGEAFAILAYLFEQRGVDRLPSEQETSDFAVVHGGRRILGRSDWPTLAGVESPVKEGALGTARNPIIVNDPRFPKNHVRRIGGKVYMNDLGADAGPFPEEAKPAEPAPPPPPAPPAPPNPPAGVITHQIDFDFSKALVFPIPAGATSALFAGELDLPPELPGGIKPLISTALGAVEGQRAKPGLLKISRLDGFGLEWDPDETRPVGSGKATSGDISYEWRPGLIHLKINGRTRTFETHPATAAEGGVISFGVNPPKPGKAAEYVRLLGGRLRGTLTITAGAAQPGSVDPPVDPLPPVDGLRAMAAEAFAKAQDAFHAVGALQQAIERSGR